MSYEIVMEPNAWNKFWAYTELCSKEVAAFGYAEPQEDYLYVSEIFLVPQEVTSGSVEFMKDGLPYAIEKAATENRIEELRFCIHSHVNMSCFFSADDTEMIEKMGSTGTPWFASAVFNKKGESQARVDLFGTNDLLPGIGQLHLDVDIKSAADIALSRQAQEDLDEFVKEAKFETKKKADKATGTTMTKPEKDGPSWREDQLHHEAKTNGYERYVSDDMAYYWKPADVGDGWVFVGSAKINPTDKDNEPWDLTDEEVVELMEDIPDGMPLGVH